jgi:hypothetical protein
MTGANLGMALSDLRAEHEDIKANLANVQTQRDRALDTIGNLKESKRLNAVNAEAAVKHHMAR